ncbi:creatininase family protein [Rhodococcus sp. IEGM 1305]|uniref:creatininase family protein n=1 Tax=Rhodococcus sp. IEGM 1305 TaxID=3047092 RepID=UPI0024B8217E|nr:creatininase family protein [Rhodococcus sp. IEGM 1305]MDI9953764.1 creatininase family protein [Rhodococcus sp. IEGM 1305]
MEDEGAMEYSWEKMTAEQLRERAGLGGLVLLPVGSIEQHGPHLPTGVDALLATEAANRVAAQLAESLSVVVAPTLWWGLAEHHMRFGGTLTLSLPTYHAVLRDVCRSIMRAGFTRIAIVNGHGGNISALNAIVNELTAELPVTIAVTTYLTAAADDVAHILAGQSGVMHACEGETSMMLAAHPELVVLGRLSDAHGPECGLQSDNVPVYLWRSFEEITESGVAGDARLATADKGEKLLAVCAQRLADLLAAPETWHRNATIDRQAAATSVGS